jgi:hypothetical protein
MVPIHGGQSVLFGFALFHPTTGGLSWLASTVVRDLDAKTGRAITGTASGRRYQLGRCVWLEDIPGEGEEAWMAFDIMLGADCADTDAVPPISADPARDILWVTACKMARHLRATAPRRTPSEVEVFLARHMEAYLELRAAAKSA